MDPVNRRHVWTFLETFKNGRIVVLTTHSMEEADVLGDQIAVMAKGKLRALGSGIQLKNLYGAGYRIGLTVLKEDLNEAKDLIHKHVPEAEMEDDSAGALIYRVPVDFTSRVPALVKILESDLGKKLVQSWGLSQTTLEEVFLKLIRDCKDEKQ
jgi:ABC-type multidrug transport system ATPase subunit